MISEELYKFDSVFPNSKYRFIGSYYDGDDVSVYKDRKKPINNQIYDFATVEKTLKNQEEHNLDKNRIGWIVPKDYIVIDIDNKSNSKYVFDILAGMGIKFSYTMSKKGGHFIFKNDRKIKSISAGKFCSLGFVVDVRCNEKGYIILPENDKDRRWGNITNDLDDVPYFLVPLSNFKSETDFKGMDDGDGRNDALLRHILALIDYAKELNISEKADSIRVINKFLFKKPISEVELIKTVLREDILKKEKDEGEKEDAGCLEERLANRILKDKHIITSGGNCYIYNGKYYRKLDSINELERMIHTEYNKNLKKSKRDEVINFIKLKTYVPTKELDKNWNEIVFKNGILNLTDMKLYEHSPAAYNTVYIDVDYIENAPFSPVIDAFFKQISSNEVDKKTLLYEIVGYCLIRKNIFSKFFICFGEGKTGKSTYLNLIKRLIGEDNCSYLSLHDLEDKYMPANLLGKLVNLGDDISYKGLKETAILKKVVTGEMLSAQVKYTEPINFSNFAKLIFTTNRLPEVHDRSSGFYRRFYIIEINKKIDNPDPFFLERLTESDYEYLLSTAVNAIMDAIKRNELTECASSRLRLKEYETEQSSVLSFLQEFGYSRDSLDKKPCTPLYLEYAQFCDESGFRKMNKQNFNRELCYAMKLTKKNTTDKNGADKNQCWRFVKSV